METPNTQKDESHIESAIDLEGFVITPEDEEAIRDAMEQQMRGLTVSKQEQE